MDKELGTYSSCTTDRKKGPLLLMFSQKRSFYLTGLLLIILAWVPLFQHLDFLPLWNYDEARRAINAWEMLQGDNWLVTTFRGEPDLWGTKPPLLVWIQACFLKLLGPTELAIRLPSALAGLATVLLVFTFVFHLSKSTLWAFLSGLALICFYGYCDIHGTRTGDYDALLTLFSTGFLFSLFLSFHHKASSRWIILSGLFLLLGALTKGIAIFLFGPAILAFLLWEKRFGMVLRNYRYYLAIGIAILGWLGYYYLREIQAPGYLEALQANELGGRFNSALEQHGNPFGHYLAVLLESPLFLFAPLAFSLFTASTPSRHRSLITYLGICSFGFWLVLSLAQTKIRWYILPAMPLLSILIGFSVSQLIGIIRTALGESLRSRIIVVSLLAALFFYPYQKVVNEVFVKKENRWGWEQSRFGWVMKRVARDYSSFSVVKGHYNAVIDFYASTLPTTQDVTIRPRYEGDYGRGEKLVICREEQKQNMADQYSYEVLEEYSGCLFVKIIAPLD